MRKELKAIGKCDRHKFTATFERFGWKNGYMGDLPTVLLIDIKMDDKTICDHLWFNLTKGFHQANLKKGDRVEFYARVSSYEKGYKGWRDDVLGKPIELDYKLSFPTKIKNLGSSMNNNENPRH